MYELALTLAIVLGHAHVNHDVLRAAASAVDEDPVPAFDSKAEELAVVMVWASHESDMREVPEPKSEDSKKGRSHGVLQQRLVLPLRDQFRVWLSNLHLAARMCGSPEGGLRMLSSGHCDRAYSLVRDRLAEADVALAFAE